MKGDFALLASCGGCAMEGEFALLACKAPTPEGRSRGMTRLVALLGISLLSVLRAGSASAEPPTAPSEVAVEVGRSVLVTLPQPPQRIAVEDASIASLEVVRHNVLRITGKQVGETRVIGVYVAQIPVVVRVRVLPPGGSR